MLTDKYNILASVAAAKILDIPNKLIKQTIKEFKGLKYRLEEIKNSLDALYEEYETLL
jgi:UDP-N-acetylmuramoylalanine-D-glutamate ligase